MEFKTGLVSVSFRSLSPEEIIDLCVSSGLKYVEWGSDVHAPASDRARLCRIADLQKQSGIVCSSYGTYFRIGTDPVEKIEEYIYAAKCLGTEVLRLWCGDRSSAEYSPEEKEALAEDCAALAAIAKKRGVVICLECHRGTFTDEKDAALWLMERVNSPAFKMYWQPEVIHSFEENLAYALALKDWVVNVHVFNWDTAGRYPLIGAAEKWRKYLSVFSGEEHLLLEFMPDDRPESLATEAKSLFEIITG